MTRTKILQRLRMLLRPQWALLTALIFCGVAAAAVYGWAWWHFLSGQMAMGQYKSDAARVHFEQCLRVWPGNRPSLLLLARAERRLGQFEQAQVHLDACRLDADPEMADAASFEWALQRAAMGDLRSVQQPLEARLLSRPDEAPLIWEALADGYRRNYRMPEALHCLDTWLHFEPQNVQAFFLRGEVNRQVGAINRAREEYGRVVELDPTHRAARAHLARALVQVGRYQEAMEHLERLLKDVPADPELLTLKARSLYDLGKREAAIELLDGVLSDHPDYGTALRERGRMALAAEQFAQAEEWFRRAQKVLPYNYEANWGLHQALRGLGKTAEAETQLAFAQQLKNRIERVYEIQTHEMTLRPTDAALHAELGELLVETGQRKSGEYWLLSALQIDPNLAAAHAALAQLYEEQGNENAAATHRQQAERLAVAKSSS